MSGNRQPIFIGIIVLAVILVGVVVYRSVAANSPNAEVEATLKTLPLSSPAAGATPPPPANVGSAMRQKGGTVRFTPPGGAPAPR